ncbi:RNA polymerase sigma factor [Ilumatobacter sp.]|uniref:RNA polymerase sigma factor n=1 Tax=Ilumatobacter sp. TaxID=1967498 RepID=UPI003B524BDC
MPLTGSAAVRLYDDHVEVVHASVARRVGASAAPAVTADAFDHAVRSWARFDPERGSERLFLLGSATAALRRHAELERAHLLGCRPVERDVGDVADPLISRRDLDDRTPRPGRGGEPAGDPRSEQHDGDRSVALVMKAVAELAPDDRDVLLLTLWEGCTQTEIAEALQMEVSEVRSRLGRIRRELKVASRADGSRRPR